MLFVIRTKPSSLTSSNYDDDQKKLTGGRNGYGAKLANIYSLEFSRSSFKISVHWADESQSSKQRTR